MAKPPATIRDVARSAGLSVASISRVLNDHDHVRPETRRKVIEAMNALGYVPNAAARSLSTAKSHAIGVVLPDLHGEFFSELVRGMDRAAAERGYLLLLSTMHADSRLASQVMGALRGRVDGLIIMAPQFSAEELDCTLPVGLPAVLINCVEGSSHHNLRIDNRGGVTLMVRHLLAGGRRNIVHLAGSAGNLDARERSQAFAEAMAALAPDLLARTVEGDFTDESGERLVQQLIAEGAEFDAIFAANDMMALGALVALGTVGVDVPSQVAVAGFDDVPMARYLGLSTIRVDMVKLGESAVRRLVDELQGQPEAPKLERLATSLVVRDTTRQ